MKESGGGEYEMYSEGFDYINEDVLGANGISFVFQVEVNGHWYGKHYPATLETPEEFPEFEIDDSSSELVCIMFYDGSEKPIDITDKFPSKEQAIKDGNEQWYKEYDWFISVLGEAAEEAECENVSENPPEEEPDYYDYDDRDRYDYYESRRRFSDFDESSEGEEEGEQFNIPDSEWKKVAGYIEKGSNFKQVGAMCRRNEMKMKSRYLILKALY